MVTTVFRRRRRRFLDERQPAKRTYSFSFRFLKAKAPKPARLKPTGGRLVQCKFNDRQSARRTRRFECDRESAEIRTENRPAKTPECFPQQNRDTSGGTVKSFVYTVTWSFKRCPAELEILDVEFAEHPIPIWRRGKKSKTKKRLTAISSASARKSLIFIGNQVPKVDSRN